MDHANEVQLMNSIVEQFGNSLRDNTRASDIAESEEGLKDTIVRLQSISKQKRIDDNVNQPHRSLQELLVPLVSILPASYDLRSQRSI